MPAAIYFTVATTWALDFNKTPGQNFDLSFFKLQTPYSSLVNVFQPQLAAYTSNVFYTAGDGAMVLWVPTGGTPIVTNGYPRTELRQMAIGGDWVVSNNVVHLETATCKVLTNPPSKRIIIGQIHGNGSGSEALKLLWNNGSVEAAFKDNYNGNQIYSTFGTWNLGDTLSYSIQESNHLITVTVNGVTVTNLLNSSWDGDTYYFKAGNYCQDNSTNSDTVSVVAFYALNTNVLGTVGAPKFNPPAGSYSSNLTVIISTPTLGTSIRYTTNGVAPTPTTGSVYSLPVTISGTSSIQAIAYDSLLPSSTITTGLYTITGPTLGVKATGTNVIISWPSGTDSRFVLQLANNLNTTNWVSAGTPVTYGGQFIVTNIDSGQARFYRLKKP
ncbi:MAG: polysaccharide lyase family 7 protein [Verrucomicrobiae bacterium]